MSDQAAIDEQVRELVRSHRTELERLVDQALAREIETLVAARLQNGNGAAHTAEPVAPATKVCSACGQDKPASAFDKYRRACRDCRRREAREQRRAASIAPAEEPPRAPEPGVDAAG